MFTKNIKPYEALIGKKIKIIHIEDTYSERYVGKMGTVKKVTVDHWGDIRLDGTWGSIGIYPKVDSYVVVG